MTTELARVKATLTFLDKQGKDLTDVEEFYSSLVREEGEVTEIDLAGREIYIADSSDYEIEKRYAQTFRGGWGYELLDQIEVGDNSFAVYQQAS